jgi:hypothetical protein
VRNRWRFLAASVAVSALIAVWLTLNVNRSAEVRRFAGLWRMREVLVAFAGGWIAILLLAAAVSRTLARQLVTFTVIAALTLSMLEGAGLAGLVDYRRLLGAERGAVLGSLPIPNADVKGVTWEDTASGWGLPAVGVPFHYKTDRRGYRNAVDREAADVYLVGDSCLVGALVPFEQTLCGRLETAVGRPVANVALIAISVQEASDRFREAKLALEGRTVLQFVFEGNDQPDSKEYRARKSGTHADRTPSAMESTLTWNFLLKAQQWLQPVHPIAPRRIGFIDDERYTFLWTAESFRGLDEEIPHILTALEETRRFVESAGGTYAVVVIPDKIRILGPLVRWPPGSDLTDYRAHSGPLPQEVVRWGLREKVPVLDLTAALEKSAQAGRVPWFAGDTHWNAVGHDVAAIDVARWMTANGLLVPR